MRAASRSTPARPSVSAVTVNAATGWAWGRPLTLAHRGLAQTYAGVGEHKIRDQRMASYDVSQRASRRRAHDAH